MGRLYWIIRCDQPNHMSQSEREEQKTELQRWQCKKNSEIWRSCVRTRELQESREAPQMTASKDMDSSLKPPANSTTLLMPWFQPSETHVRFPVYKTIKIIKLCCFNPLGLRLNCYISNSKLIRLYLSIYLSFIILTLLCRTKFSSSIISLLLVGL
jgi:hypothetical protein